MQNREIKFTDYLLEQVEELNRQERFSTAKNVLCACRSFSDWIGRKKCTLSSISEEMICNYSRYLSKKGIRRNTISCYLRSMRACYNRAVSQKLTPQNHPFDSSYTGVDKTPKRSISETLLSDMQTLPLPPGSPLDMARDLYLFSFSMRGMAFIDIANLKNTDISCGTVRYSRQKTGQTLIIKLEPFQKRIIKKYEDKGRKYVFPILQGGDPQFLYRTYRSALHKYNDNLKAIGKLLHSRNTLTSYTARHTWATSALNHNLPLQVISAGLGHTSYRTTEIYLSSLDNNIIDTANRKLLKCILKH